MFMNFAKTIITKNANVDIIHNEYNKYLKSPFSLWKKRKAP